MITLDIYINVDDPVVLTIQVAMHSQLALIKHWPRNQHVGIEG